MKLFKISNTDFTDLSLINTGFLNRSGKVDVIFLYNFQGRSILTIIQNISVSIGAFFRVFPC